MPVTLFSAAAGPAGVNASAAAAAALVAIAVMMADLPNLMIASRGDSPDGAVTPVCLACRCLDCGRGKAGSPHAIAHTIATRSGGAGLVRVRSRDECVKRVGSPGAG